MKPVIRQANPQEAEWLQTSFPQIGWTKPDGYFAQTLIQQSKGELILLVAEMTGAYLGHTKVVWQPGYPPFREQAIPEIQDLNVLPAYRRQGVASRLLDMAEALMAERSPVAGIGVGLYADYGPAQRLYVRRRYIPDGRGVYYEGQPVIPGASVPVDDSLVLYFTKNLQE